MFPVLVLTFQLFDCAGLCPWLTPCSQMCTLHSHKEPANGQLRHAGRYLYIYLAECWGACPDAGAIAVRCNGHETWALVAALRKRGNCFSFVVRPCKGGCGVQSRVEWGKSCCARRYRHWGSQIPQNAPDPAPRVARAKQYSCILH